jgi:hypothetical protein
LFSLCRDFGSGPSEAYQLDEEGSMEAGGGALNFSVLPAGFFAGTGDSHFSAADVEVFALSAEQVMAISMARAGGLEAGPDKPNYRAPPLNNLVNLLSSKILTDNTYAAPLGRFFAGNTKCPSRLLYRATRDGFKPNDWQEKCVNQGPTLTIVKSQSGNIFGQFPMIKCDSLRCSVCRGLFCAHRVVFLVVSCRPPLCVCSGGYAAQNWPTPLSEVDGGGRGKWTSISDPSRKSFLFSLVNVKADAACKRPLRFRLVDPDKAAGIRTDWGPLFGFGNSRNIQFGVQENPFNDDEGCWSVFLFLFFWEHTH